MGSSLTGRPRRRAVAHIHATQPLCWLCGYPIDDTLDRQRHPLGASVDEIQARSHGGSTTDHTNLRRAHRICNSSRGNRTPDETLRARCQALVEPLLGIHKRPTGTTRNW